jgi:concanavalin A-like lectin/glucanase superfamily protein
LTEPPSKYAHYEHRPFEAGRWSHAAVVLDGGNSLSFYADGQLTDPPVMSPPPILPGTPTLHMGRWMGPSPARFFSGSLDDVAIYNRALSAAEVAELNTRPPPRPR